MVSIFHISNEEQFPLDQFYYLERLLPEQFSGTFFRYRRWQDRQASLLGKLLLRQLLIENGIAPSILSTYKLDNYARPSIKIEGDFNISHTEGKVVVGLTDAPRIGIDIEKIKDINPVEFSRVFTPEEINLIGLRRKRNHNFYDIWTKKEAAMKADGRGFYLDAAKINTLSKAIRIDTAYWYTKPITIAKGYICHYSLASPAKRQTVSTLSLDSFSEKY